MGNLSESQLGGDSIFYHLGSHGLISFSDYIFLLTILSTSRCFYGEFLQLLESTVKTVQWQIFLISSHARYALMPHCHIAARCPFRARRPFVPSSFPLSF